jgi:transcriptional regulator with GAF, ATPase, and Fis domain
VGRPAPEIGAATLAYLRSCAWPGNVRELRAVIERALVADPVCGLEALAPSAGPVPPVTPVRDLNLRESLQRTERDLLLEAQRRSGGVHKEAARLLGIDPRNLSYFLRKHGLSPSGDDGSAR